MAILRSILGLLVLSAPLQAQSVARSLASAEAQNTSPGLQSRISVSVDKAQFAQALETIARQSGAKIVIASGARINKQVTLHAQDITTEQAFRSVLEGTGIRMTVAPDGQILFSRMTQISKAQGVIAGKVTDARSGKGISGVTVSVNSSNQTASTTEDGSYRLSGINPGSYTVTVRLVGYAKQTRTVVVGDGVTVAVDFKIEPSANVLDQVIVTGTVIASELKSVPNAITVVTAKQIEERGITRIDQLFRGDVPGLFAQNQGSLTAFNEVTMFSRGASTIVDPLSGQSGSAGTSLGTNPIKTYVDGVEMADSKYLSQIDPRSIERIEILTGPQASTIYGSNAINGVMQIFTKRGTSNRPRLSVNLMSGWVENNFKDTRTPQHDYSAQIQGIEGRVSYNVGSSWTYTGPWTPANQSSLLSTFGGTRLEFPTRIGRFTTDANIRRGVTRSLRRGNAEHAIAGFSEVGWYRFGSQTGITQPMTSLLTGTTSGIEITYNPTSWWSHGLGWGRDASNVERIITARGYLSQADSTLFFDQSNIERRSLRYTTTASVSATSFLNLSVIAGADEWQTLTSTASASGQALTGTLSNPAVTRKSAHNTGAFMQSQMALWDKLFFTYGLRAEWNPDYGSEAEPNLAPRYGVAYTREFGGLTAKMRASYGRSTRPPQAKLKNNVTAPDFFTSLWPSISPFYNTFDYYLSNPDLGPEYQQGGEGGVELYFGTRGSLVVTRFNQTIEDLIMTLKVDSVRSLVPCPPSIGCGFGILDDAGYQYRYKNQYLNIGSVRNQGWELQGTMNLGPITTRSTYSWTKSRTIGVNPKYRNYFANDPKYQIGGTFQFLPEHTWALGATYARASNTIALSVTGIGRVINRQDDYFVKYLSTNIRLQVNRQSLQSNNGQYVSFNDAYSMADLTASHRFMSRLEGVLQVQNMTNKYINDYQSTYSTIGRQTKVGLRIR